MEVIYATCSHCTVSKTR